MNHGWLNKENHIEFIKHSFEKFLSSRFNVLPLEKNTQEGAHIIQFDSGFYTYTSHNSNDNPICYLEKLIKSEEINFMYLKEQVELFYSYLKVLENDFHGVKSFLPSLIVKVELNDLEKLYPEHSYKQAIRAITQKYGAIFLAEHLSCEMLVWDCMREDTVKIASIELMANSDAIFDTYRVLLSESPPQVIRGKIYFKSLVGLLTPLFDFNSCLMISE
jgi:hypothetical protein